MEIRISMHTNKDDKDVLLDVIYFNDEVKIIRHLKDDETVETIVPKFGCVLINKCNQTSEEVCKKEVAFKNITAKRQQAGKPVFTFNATPAFSFYYWYFYDGTPLFSDQEKPANIEIAKEGNTLVRVIGINDDGCFAILEKTVKVS